MRPIDADVVCSECTSYYAGNCPSEDSVGCAVKDAPTLTLDDLRPKGRWINWGKSGTPTYENYGTCSACHEDAEIHTEHRNFCPNCGADMRGGGEDA